MSNRRRLYFLGLTVGLTLSVGVLSVWLSALFFPPHFRGWGELTADGAVAGWVVNRSDPSERVQVQLYLDGRLVAVGTADLPRPDVVAAGYARDERCGYRFNLPRLAAGLHEARVYSSHSVASGAYRTLQLTGRPIRFTLDERGKATAASP